MDLDAPTAIGRRSIWRSEVALLVYVAAVTVIIHLCTGGRYGFHRDELATLDDARHLAWGYVAYPPLTPFFGRLSLVLFGTSLTGFRFFAALACAGSIVLTGLMAREMGGGRFAQLVAAVAATPFSLAAGSLMQYVSFDYLWWVLAAYFLIRLCQSDNPRWWVAIGSAIGFGMLTKYSMLICVAGIVTGVLATDLRRHLKSKWLWLGVACSLLIFLPNLIWQVWHDFISLEFLRHIHERDVRIGRTKDFLPDQLEMTLLAFPLALAGLYYYLFTQPGRRFRALAWLYLVPLVLFLVARGRGYYLAPAYPLLFAGGSVWLERAAQGLRTGWLYLASLIGGALALDIVLVGAIALPLAPINSPWFHAAVKINNDLAEEIGWPELIESLAAARDGLPPADRTHYGILAANYGEAGAINLYGPGHGLPQPICGTNSFWARRYNEPPPQTLIVIGFSREFVEHHFESFEVVARVSNRYGVANEETTSHPDIYVCRGLRQTWPEFWKTFQHFG